MCNVVPVARHAPARVVVKVTRQAHGTQRATVAVGATRGGTLVAGQARVGDRAMQERFVGVVGVGNVPVIVFVPKRGPTWGRLIGAAIGAVGAREAFPLRRVVGHNIVEVFAHFADAPRWQFTPRAFLVGYFSSREAHVGAVELSFGVLVVAEGAH